MLKCNTNGFSYLINQISKWLRLLRMRSNCRNPSKIKSHSIPRNVLKATYRGLMTSLLMDLYGRSFIQHLSQEIQRRSRSIYLERIRFGITWARPRLKQRHSLQKMCQDLAIIQGVISWILFLNLHQLS